MNVTAERIGEFQSRQTEEDHSQESELSRPTTRSQGMSALSLALSCLSVGGFVLGENVIRIIQQGLNGESTANAALGTAIFALGIVDSAIAFRRFKNPSKSRPSN